MASNWIQLSLTRLELKGLWIRATGGSTEGDVGLDLAAEKAIEKLYRAESGMLPPRPPQEQKPGKGMGLLWKPRAEV